MDEDSDQRHNHIIFRRSTNGGRSWEQARVIVDFGEDFHANNPVAVQVRDGNNQGRILLTVTRLTKSYSDDAQGFMGPDCGRHYITYSDNDGVTWSPLREITRLVRNENSRKVVAGPGSGIQVRWGDVQGRVVLPFTETKGAFVLWSEDGGDSWIRGESNGNGGEIEVAELIPVSGKPRAC